MIRSHIQQKKNLNIFHLLTVCRCKDLITTLKYTLLSSASQTEPQVKFFSQFQVEKEDNEEPQKSCKPSYSILLTST